MTAACGEANRRGMPPSLLHTAPPAPPSGTTDRLFGLLERIHGDKPWGRLLDAGTGEHSLRWVLSLPTTGWTAITGGEGGKGELGRKYAAQLRPQDGLIVGDWADPVLLVDEQYDVILADYLLGALDGFAPYFQDRLFPRLRQHLRPGGALYVIGLGPFPDQAETEGGRLILEISRLRDACILLAGHRCYREYPDDWARRALEAAGLVVDHSERMSIRFRERYVNGQLDVCLSKLPLIRDPALVASLRAHIEDLRGRALAVVADRGGIDFGHDYVIAAHLPA